MGEKQFFLIDNNKNGLHWCTWGHGGIRHHSDLIASLKNATSVRDIWETWSHIHCRGREYNQTTAYNSGLGPSEAYLTKRNSKEGVRCIDIFSFSIAFGFNIFGCFCVDGCSKLHNSMRHLRRKATKKCVQILCRSAMLSINTYNIMLCQLQLAVYKYLDRLIVTTVLVPGIWYTYWLPRF